jgi:PAS domain S-box-containing protein
MSSKRSSRPLPVLLTKCTATSTHGVEAALALAEASEAQAAERAENLHTILETMADGVIVYDRRCYPLQINRAYRELLALDHAPAGYESLPARERLRLLDMRDATTGAPLPFDKSPAGRALKGGEVVTGQRADVCLRAFDGRELEVTISAAPLRDREGHVVGAVCVLHDQTERNRLAREREAARADELAAREAGRRLEAFLAIAAHDLRAPLGAVVGFLDLAERQTERLAAVVQEAHPELAPRADAVGARLLALLFDTAALRAGKLELHRAPLDLVALVRAQVAGLRIAAPERTIRLHLPASGEHIVVEADADRIGQVVANYLTNALKYSPPDRPVEVRVAAHGGRARVIVCDQGPGIPTEEQARVWELFHRAPGAIAHGTTPGGTPRSTPGGVHTGSLGLGLHICKAIIRAHGGQVGVKSTLGERGLHLLVHPASRMTCSAQSDSECVSPPQPQRKCSKKSSRTHDNSQRLESA